jgi:SMC interacting uncharacterized protein involved in chromosome segregation
MSDPNESVTKTGANGTEGSQSEEFVSKRAYEEVTRDMHKYKNSAKEAAAAKSEYEAKLKQLEEEKLQEQNRFKELYEREKQEREALEKKSRDKDQAYLTAVKKSALKSELGGKVKDLYLNHANLAGIEISEEGIINQESLLKVANEFRKNHGELIPVETAGDPTSTASPTDTTVSHPHTKPVGEMDSREFRSALAAAPVKLKG